MALSSQEKMRDERVHVYTKDKRRMVICTERCNTVSVTLRRKSPGRYKIPIVVQRFASHFFFFKAQKAKHDYVLVLAKHPVSWYLYPEAILKLLLHL